MAMPCCSASRPGDDATSHERAYLFLFFVSLLASWILRDFDVAVTSSVTPGLRGCVDGHVVFKPRRCGGRLARPDVENPPNK